MTSFTDEQLMAVADGQSSPQEMDTIRAAAAADAELRARLQAFETSRRLLRRAFGAKRAEPVPDRLLAVFGHGPATPAASPRRPYHYPVALAAAVVAGVIGALAYVLVAGREATLLPSAELLAAALEATPSGAAYAHDVGATRQEIVPVRTLRRSDGAWCREFEFADLSGAQVRRLRGLACRTMQGMWGMRAILPARALGPSEPRRDGAYRPASGPESLADLGPVETMDSAREAQLIADHWR